MTGISGLESSMRYLSISDNPVPRQQQVLGHAASQDLRAGWRPEMWTEEADAGSNLFEPPGMGFNFNGRPLYAVRRGARTASNQQNMRSS
jgi:hypothetical protein